MQRRLKDPVVMRVKKENIKAARRQNQYVSETGVDPVSRMA